MITSVSLLDRLAAAPTEDDWQRLVGVYQPLLHTWMAQLGVKPADADDLAQEVLLVVFREVGAFRRQAAGAFRGWLRAVLVHRVRDHFRKRKHLPTATGDSDFQRRLDELQSPASGLSRLWDRDHDEHVAAALLRQVRGDFAPVTWQAFCRYVLDGQAVADVARDHGPSANSVLVAKSRVLKRLRQELYHFIG